MPHLPVPDALREGAVAMARHDFMVLAVEPDSSGRDKAMYRWCRRCGLVRITSTPEWDDCATYLMPGVENGCWRGEKSPPPCIASSGRAA